MRRRKAVAMTAVTALACAGLAWAAERWPNVTIGGLALATIYLRFRATEEAPGVLSPAADSG